MASKVGATVTSLEVENSILSSAFRSIPSAMLLVVYVFELASGGKVRLAMMRKKVWWSRRGLRRRNFGKTLLARLPIYLTDARSTSNAPTQTPLKVLNLRSPGCCYTEDSYQIQATAIMLLDEQRQIHEDLERLEDAIAERLLEDPPHVCHSCALHCRQTDVHVDSRPSRT
jgi:hypothetical protein